MKDEIRRFKNYPPRYWQGIIGSQSFEKAKAYGLANGLSPGAAILFAKFACPRSYNELRAKENPQINRLAGVGRSQTL